MTIVRNRIPNPAPVGTAGFAAVSGTLSSYPIAGGQWPAAVRAITDAVAVVSASGSSTSLFLRTSTLAADRMPVSPGEYVSASAWCATDSGILVRMRLRFYDAAGTQLGTAITGPTSTPRFYDGAWLTLEGVAPATAASWVVELYGVSTTSGGTIPAGQRIWGAAWTADVFATEAEAIAYMSLPYRDGDSPGWVWDGTPDASTSRGPDALVPLEARLHFAGDLALGAPVSWIETVDGWREEAESGVVVSRSPVSTSRAVHVQYGPSGSSSGELALQFGPHELGDGRPDVRARAAYAALREGVRMAVRWHDTELDMTGAVYFAPVGTLALERVTADHWIVRSGFDRMDAAVVS